MNTPSLKQLKETLNLQSIVEAGPRKYRTVEHGGDVKLPERFGLHTLYWYVKEKKGN